MRGMVIFVLVLVGLASFSFVAANISNEIIKPKKSSEVLQFSTFTSAVCERGKDVVRCKDEFFVNCNGEITKTERPCFSNKFRIKCYNRKGRNSERCRKAG